MLNRLLIVAVMLFAGVGSTAWAASFEDLLKEKLMEGLRKQVPPSDDKLTTPPPTAQPPSYLSGPCSVQGSILNLPDYLKMMVHMNADTPSGKTELARYRIEPGTARFDLNISGLACDAPPGLRHNYRLYYNYGRAYGRADEPRYTSWVRAVDYGYPAQYGVRVSMTDAQRVFTDITRDFSQLSHSGILVEDISTDRPSYRFGDIVTLRVTTSIRGPRGLTPAVEEAEYVVTTQAGGLEFEAGRGTLSVTAGTPVTTAIKIHHSKYSRGSNGIHVKIKGLDYEWSGGISRVMD